MRDYSRCRKKRYCDFKPIVDNSEAQVEICVQCSKKVIYRKDETGRIDNAKYLRDHIRDTVQPFGRTRKIFLEIYGDKPIQQLRERMRGKKDKAQQRREWDQMKQDLKRRLSQKVI